MARLLERIRIGIVGLGWIGQEVARAALEDPRVRLVGVADVDPMKAGRDLGEIIGEGRIGIPIDPSITAMLARARPEVAILCTTSDVEKLGPDLEACVAHGAHVVTTCENLADPETALAQLDPGFEERVRKNGLVVLATGVNPGFAMDRLPVMLTQATRNIRRVRVVRVVNASLRRAQLQAKIGVGMTAHAFSEAIKRGEIGHAGLSASLRLLAKGLGLTLEKTSEAFTPLIAEQATSSSVLGPVKAGGVRGIYQIARGYRARREVVTLELTMALDEPHPRDTIDIVGEPPLHFEGELPGDTCTIAAVLSAIAVIVTMPPGLRTVLDVPLEQPEEPGSAHDSLMAVRRSRATTMLPAPSAEPRRADRTDGDAKVAARPEGGTRKRGPARPPSPQVKARSRPAKRVQLGPKRTRAKKSGEKVLLPKKAYPNQLALVPSEKKRAEKAVPPKKGAKGRGAPPAEKRGTNDRDGEGRAVASTSKGARGARPRSGSKASPRAASNPVG